MKKQTTYFLIGVLLLSFSLHIWRISVPKHAVFDEVHYATYAAQYATRTPFFDIHPPLGKFIYSIPLHFFSNKDLRDSPFVVLKKDNIVKYELKNRNYSTFPYIPLRVISSLFGTFLVFVVFLFTKRFTNNESVALLASFFIALENSLIVETRFILLDGMFLSLSFLALWKFFDKRDSGIVSGILWGFALATKLVAVIFLPFAILKKSGFWKNYKFISFGFLTLGIIWIGIQSYSFPTQKWFTFMSSVNTNVSTQITSIPKTLTPLQNISLKSYLLFNEITWSLQGYSTIQATHAAQSKWFEWPFMIGSFCYSEKENPFCIIGNPALWVFGIIAVLATGIYLVLKWLKKQKSDIYAKTFFVGYLFVLLPFAIIPRYMFIYHYFPALVFSLCLSAYWIIKLCEKLEEKYKITSYILVILITIIGFLAISPATFGIR